MGRTKRKPSNFRKANYQFENRGGDFKRNKRFDSSYEQPLGDPSAAETMYRLLCPAKKIGGIIGKGGDIIKKLRDETGAKIKIGETIPGTDERVVIIFSSSTKKPRGFTASANANVNARDNLETPEDLEKKPEEVSADDNLENSEEPENHENDVPENDALENDAPENDVPENDAPENDAPETDAPETDAPIQKEQGSMPPHCSAQDALLKVHERIVDEDIFGGGGVAEDDLDKDIVTARLLVPNNQVGCLLGKGGHVIQRLRNDTGANIRILPPDHLPACASTSDELVQISGLPDVAKRALYEVSTLLYNNPRPSMNYPIPAGDGFHPPGASLGDVPPPGNQRWSRRNSDFRGPSPMPGPGGFGNDFPRFAQGGFNGPPAGHARKASAEFSMKILCPAEKIGWVIGKGGSKVMQIQKGTGARIDVEDASTGSDERVILVSCFDAPWNPKSPTIEAMLQLQISTNGKEGTVITRLLVPSSKVGCLLGQSGRIINEMRRRTQADIRIISDDGKPKFASIDEELVQISGNLDVARDALTEIASRLRMRSLEGLNEPGPVGPFQGFGPPESFPARGPPPPGMIGAGSSGGYEHVKGGGHGYRPPAAASGYPIIHSSMEVKIPNITMNSVLGRNISNIGQMSGAKVKLNDSQSGGSECIVEIHGSCEQMNAAQNLLQSFISSAAQNFNTQQHQVPHGSATQQFNAYQQPTSYASSMQNLNPQKQHSPYASVPNFSAQHQQNPYPSAPQNFKAQQQQSSYPSAAQNYNTQQQQSPYASAAQNFNAPQQQNQYPSAAPTFDPQQHQNHYTSAAQNLQQQQNPYASATQNFDSQQQQYPYASAAQNFDSQQQQNYYASAAQKFDSQQQQNPYASAAQNFDPQQQQNTYSSAPQNFSTQHQQFQQPSPYAAVKMEQQQQQQNTYASAPQNLNTQHQQYQQPSPYAAVKMEQQLPQSSYASAPQNLSAQHQQYQQPSAYAAVKVEQEQLQQQSYEMQQQQAPYQY